MEEQRRQCLKCGEVFVWWDFKTGIGKTDEQMVAFHQRLRVCHNEHCGGPLVDRWNKMDLYPDERAKYMAELQATDWDIL